MHDHVALVQRYLDAAYRGDLAAAGALLADDVRLVMGGGGVIAGEYAGREAFFGAFGRMLEVSRGTYRMAAQEAWLAGDGHALLLAQEQVERDGTTHVFHRAISYRIADDRITEVRVYEGDPAVAALAFAA